MAFILQGDTITLTEFSCLVNTTGHKNMHIFLCKAHNFLCIREGSLEQWRPIKDGGQVSLEIQS